MVRFDYVKPLEDSATCVVFLAQTKDNLQVVVKFIDRYGDGVHEFLAERGYVPRLRYCGPLPSLQPAQPPLPSPPGLSFGPLKIIVMDYVKPLSSKYSGNYIEMDTSLVICENLTSSPIGQINPSSLISIGRVDMT